MKLYLTEAGRALLGHAETILRAHDEAKAALAGLGQASRGRLRIGVTSTTFTLEPLPEILAEIKRRFALLDLLVVGGTSERIVEQILAGHLDVGIVSLPVEASDLTTETLRSDRLVAVMNPTHRMAGEKSVTMEALAAEPLILSEHGGNTRRLLDLFFEKHHLEPTIIMELQRTEAIIKMVELGFGVTILPQGATHTAVARGTLRSVPVQQLDVRWQFGVAYLKSDYIAPALDAFLKLCRAYIAGARGPHTGE